MKLEKLININWYIKNKPYEIHTNYDIFYLNICRKIFKILKSKNDATKDDLTEDALCEIAYNITAYFEDVVNNIGMWKSLKALNTEHFGKSLPFFPKEQSENAEEDNDISKNDIHYLMFLSIVSLFNTEDNYYLVDFNKPFITESATSVFEYLDAIEEVSITNFYEDFFNVKALDYIGVKTIASWFAFRGYITRIEFSRILLDINIEVLQTDKSEEERQQSVYAQSDIYTFTHPSNVTAYFPADILAGVIRGSQQDKEDIQNFKFRPNGIMDIIKERKDHVIFRHTDTGDEFNVTKKTIEGTDVLAKCKQWYMTIAKWKDQYNISGFMLGIYDETKKKTFKNYSTENPHLYRKHNKAYRQKIMDIAAANEEKMLEFFGSRLIDFDNGEEMQDKLNEYFKYYFKALKKGKRYADLKPIEEKLPADILNRKDISIFIPPLNVMSFIPGNKYILSILQNTAIHEFTEKDRKECEDMFFNTGIEAQYWLYLKEKFELPNLSALLLAPVDDPKDFEALLRIYKPEDFSLTLLPRYSMI